MTSTHPATPPSPDRDTPAGDFAPVLASLEERFPRQRPSVLFCVWKLQQDPEASLRDFREEAKARGIPVAGRALHSAKVLLGLAEPSTRRSPAAKTRSRRTAPGTRSAPRRPAAAARSTIEDSLLDAVRRMQIDANQDVERLRKAMREAIALLEHALRD